MNLVLFKNSFTYSLFLLLPTDDNTRVILKTVEGQPGSDYINASYINVSKSFIQFTQIITKEIMENT